MKVILKLVQNLTQSAPAAKFALRNHFFKLPVTHRIQSIFAAHLSSLTAARMSEGSTIDVKRFSDSAGKSVFIFVSFTKADYFCGLYSIHAIRKRKSQCRATSMKGNNASVFSSNDSLPLLSPKKATAYFESV